MKIRYVIKIFKIKIKNNSKKRKIVKREK